MREIISQAVGVEQRGSTQTVPQARSAELIVEVLADETLIFDLRTNKAHCLNRLASLVWHACDGQRTIDQVRAHVQAQQQQAQEQQAQEQQVLPLVVVELALSELERAQLLDVASPKDEPAIAAELLPLPASYSPSTGSTPTLSRRDLLRRAGTLAAAAAVTSIVAPTVAQASTGATAPRGTACTAGRNCSSGVCSNGTCQ